MDAGFFDEENFRLCDELGIGFVGTGKRLMPLRSKWLPSTRRARLSQFHTHRSVRSGFSYGTGIKNKISRDDGLSPEVARAMILDHIIPLARGGHPRQRPAE